ncbi:hypothetical protein BG653_06537 [Streptomyces platensis]|uniref:Uncharacterized protein n=1 Tax=Streptomyces platensis TaxID=58346 RepID=A0ABX3XN58_STRPT|nr:hypothetical protein BG653_06537 [Streptomyces platensis]
MSVSSTTPATRNMPPYSSVSRIRMVGRSHGGGRRRGSGSVGGAGGRRGGAGAWEAGATALNPGEPAKRASRPVAGQEVNARLILPQMS